MFSNWPRSEEEEGKRKKTETEGRGKSGMAGLVAAWLWVCGSKLLCLQLALFRSLIFHAVPLCTASAPRADVSQTTPHPKIPLVKLPH